MPAILALPFVAIFGTSFLQPSLSIVLGSFNVALSYLVFLKLFGKKEKESIDKGLEKTKQGFFEKISKVIIGKTTVDDALLDELEEALIGADVGVDTTLALIERIQERVKKEKYISTSELNKLLHDELVSLLVDAPSD